MDKIIKIEDAVKRKLKRYQTALKEIVDCHGTHYYRRHECAKMAHLARTALDEEGVTPDGADR